MSLPVESTEQSGTNAPGSLRLVDPLGSMIAERWQQGSEALSRQRRDYWLNSAFFLGEQWIWWDRSRRTVQELPQQYSPLGPGRARLTVNRMAPNVGSVLGRLLKSELTFDVIPTAVADDATTGAKRAERVLFAYHRDQEWESHRYDAVLAAILGGTSAVAVEWDGRRGTKIEEDETTGAMVATGDVRLSSVNVTEFCVEPYVRDYRDATWWCQGVALPPKHVQQLYGLSWTPKADAGSHLSPLQHRLLADGGKPSGRDVCLVLTYYERPNPKNKKGTYACVVNGQVIHRSAWPFPFDRLNLAIFRQRKMPGQWVGTTYLNDAVPLQFAYNHARSVLAEHMKLTGNARLMAPFGAFTEEDFTDNPGSILWYSPDLGGAAPGYLTPPQLPRWLTTEADNLRAELDDIMYVHDSSRGVGFDRASGQALAILSEKDDGPLGSMVFEQRRGWSDLGRMVLEILGDKATETRTLNVPAAPGIPEVVEFNGATLRKQYDVTVPLESVAPRTKAQQMMYAKDLWDRQILTDPRQYARMAGLPPDSFAELLDADAARAQRENLRMQTGYVELPEDFDMHDVHIAEHNRQRKSDAYKYADETIRSLFDDHIRYHEMKAHQELAAQQQRAAVDPALAAVAQGNEPTGSQIPPDAVEAQAAMARTMGSTGGASNSPNMGAGGTSPGAEGLAQMLTSGGSGAEA